MEARPRVRTPVVDRRGDRDHVGCVRDDFEKTLREQWLPASEEYSISMLAPSVRLLGAEAGIVSFRFEDREVGRSGNVRTGAGALGYVFERIEDKWMLVRIHHSGPVPPEFGGG